MSTRFSILSVAALVLVATVAWTLAPAPAGDPALLGPVHVNTSSGFTASGHPLALHGHDPVAYFTEDGPRLGDARHSAVHDGATYRFASAENLEAFEADPARFAPRFGGYCAYGVSVGKKFDGDPRQWAVVDGKLYLNLNASIRALWNEDVAGNVRKAVGEWAAIRDRAPAAL